MTTLPSLLASSAWGHWLSTLLPTHRPVCGLHHGPEWSTAPSQCNFKVHVPDNKWRETSSQVLFRRLHIFLSEMAIQSSAHVLNHYFLTSDRAGSVLLHGLPLAAESGAALSLQGSGFSPWRLLLLRRAGSRCPATAVLAPGLESRGSAVAEHGFSCPSAWKLPRSGPEPMSPALAARLLTAEPPGAPWSFSLIEFLTHGAVRIFYRPVFPKYNLRIFSPSLCQVFAFSSWHLLKHKGFNFNIIKIIFLLWIMPLFLYLRTLCLTQDHEEFFLCFIP